MRILSIAAFVATTVVSAGCGLITGPDAVIGIVERIGPSLSAIPPKSVAQLRSSDPTPPAACCDDDPVLEAPDTVRAAVAFTVLVRTYGAHGCWRGTGAETTATTAFSHHHPV